MRHVMVFAWIGHAAFVSIYLLIAKVIRTIVDGTGGDVSLVWKWVPTVLAFTLFSMVCLFPGRASKLERVFIMLNCDFIYVFAGLAMFVLYVNNILISMG